MVAVATLGARVGWERSICNDAKQTGHSGEPSRQLSTKSRASYVFHLFCEQFGTRQVENIENRRCMVTDLAAKHMTTFALDGILALGREMCQNTN